MSAEELTEIKRLESKVDSLAKLIQSERTEHWLVKHWPMIVVAAGLIAWGAKLENDMHHHKERPWHKGLDTHRDNLIQLQVELRHIREGQMALRQQLDDLEKKIMP